ncbi:MAG: MarR family winged helix-turn-helix transcriptional regulator [Planctomycetota bacterium]|jgi:DNA-binding MarR family transcriptional regulator
MERSEQIRSLLQSFSRLERFFSQLMREQFSCCGATVQQWNCLEVLLDGPKSMNALAAGVALHQSTVTRIVEKLEKQGLAGRTRKAGNQRSVEVRITESGRNMYMWMDGQCSQMTSDLLDLLPKGRQAAIVESMEEFSKLLDPSNQAFQEILKRCGDQSECCKQEQTKGDKQ